MAQSINTSYAVIVLGDRETTRRVDLAEKAAEQGAQIVQATPEGDVIRGIDRLGNAGSVRNGFLSISVKDRESRVDCA